MFEFQPTNLDHLYRKSSLDTSPPSLPLALAHPATSGPAIPQRLNPNKLSHMQTLQASSSLATLRPSQENLREYDFRKRCYVNQKRRHTLGPGSNFQRPPLTVVTNLADDTQAFGLATGSGARPPSGLPADPTNNGPRAKLFVKGHGAVTEYLGKTPFRSNTLNSQPVGPPVAGPSRLPLAARPPTPPKPVLRSILKDSNVTTRRPSRSQGNPHSDASRVHFSPGCDESDNKESERTQLQVPTSARIPLPPISPTTPPTPTQWRRLLQTTGHVLGRFIKIVSDFLAAVSFILFFLWALLLLMKWLLT